ncbi:MAG: hypothetical protein NVS9B3_09110 [Gemmatimonadaceae bacterium]
MPGPHPYDHARDETYRLLEQLDDEQALTRHEHRRRAADEVKLGKDDRRSSATIEDRGAPGADERETSVDDASSGTSATPSS